MSDSQPTYRWAIQAGRNPWFSLGLHFDHRGPFVQLHLPGVIVTIGRVRNATVTRKCPCGRRDSWTWDWADGSPPAEAA